MENISSENLLATTANSSSSNPYEYLVLWFALSISTNIIGSLCNGTCVAVFFLNKRLFFKPTYQILFGIFISNFMICMVFKLFENTQQFHWFYMKTLIGNDLICKIETPLYILMSSITNIGQMLCSSCRVLAVFAPFFYKKYITTKSTFIFQMVVSISFPLVFHLAAWDTFIVYKMDKKNGDCQEKDLSHIYLILRRVIFMFLPVYTALIQYIVILVKLSLRGSQPQGTTWYRLRTILATLGFIICYSISATLSWWPLLTSGKYSREELGRYLWNKLLFRVCYSIYPVS